MILASSMKFPLGRLSITPAALEAIPSDEICCAIDSHVCGRWGDVSAADHAANEFALQTGQPLRSVYHTTADKIPFIVLTTADRATTAVRLLSED
jgi:hypothetical protein